MRISKKWLALPLKLAVSGALIWFLFSNVDLGAVKARLADIAPAMVMLAAFVLVVQVIICARRWQAVLDAIRSPLPFLTALRIFLIGAFFSQTLPSSVGGDAVRMYKAYHAGLSVSGAVNGVMLERAATVVALVLLVIATQPVFLTRADAQVGAWLIPTLALFAAATVAGLALLMVLDRLPGALRRWRLVRGLAHLAADTRRLFLAPAHAFKALGWAVTGHVNLALAVYLLAASLDIEATWVDCMALVPPVLLVTAIPISIAGWGVREGAMVVAFGFIGVPAASALVLSVLLGLVIIAVSLPGGAIWLISGGKRSDMVTAPGDALRGETGAAR